VVTLPTIAGPEVEGRFLSYAVEVGGRSIAPAFYPRKQVRDAVARADKWLASIKGQSLPWLKEDSAETIEHLRDRLIALQSRGDPDIDAELVEAAQLSDALALADKGVDPFARKTGVLRLAYRSPVDGELQEYGLYVPPSYKPGGAKKPLVVVLHGLNGRPLSMIRYFFGGDDPNKEGDWEDRHVEDFLKDKHLELDAFVVAPSGHGNTMYRDLGEDDVLRVTDRVIARYPIDRDRITITGPSMGGIGAAAIPLHAPDVFAAAMPLCGYHSYFVRRDILGRPMRPWERAIAEQRSNALWAENGARLPLFIVHGTQDLPVENSQVLIDRYEALKFDVEHEHPNLGHNVWQTTYEGLKGASWLLKHRRTAHPSEIKFKTMSLRHGDDAWVHVTEMDDVHAWATVEAKVRGRSIVATTKNVAELRFDRDPKLLDPTKDTPITIDGQTVIAPASEAMVLHKDGNVWWLGPATHGVPWKKGHIAGPLRDVLHEPILFVYGADDPEQTRANEQVARAWAAIRAGVHVKYPVLSDAEFLAKSEPLTNDRALFLVGNAKSNRVLRALEPELPIKIKDDAVLIGDRRITGKQLGAAFIRPNPKRPDRYLVVIEGVDALGTWRSLSLPDLLPDFVVYDEAIAPSRGQMLLSAGSVRAAGFFQNDWSLPTKMDDPLAQAVRPAAASERDATPYLP
jgi:poly(3-hydroxybutyrate) depolymerase